MFQCIFLCRAKIGFLTGTCDDASMQGKILARARKRWDCCCSRCVKGVLCALFRERNSSYGTACRAATSAVDYATNHRLCLFDCDPPHKNSYVASDIQTIAAEGIEMA